MKMSPQEVELTIRDLYAGLLRAFVATTVIAVTKLDEGPATAIATASLFYEIQLKIRALEMPYGKDNIPAPEAAKEKSLVVIHKIADELEQLCNQIFSEE